MEIRSRSSSPAVAEGAITAATQGGAGGGHGGDDRASTMSNNNVTPFPGRKRPTQEQVAAQERERAEHGAREEDKRRLKKQLEQNQPLKAADQISVAQNLNGLFVRLKKEHGLGSSKILATKTRGITRSPGIYLARKSRDFPADSGITQTHTRVLSS